MVESGGIKDYLLLGRFQMGRRDGQWVQWHRNGVKEVEGVYYKGKKDGEWTLWYEDELLKEQGQFNLDAINLVVSYVVAL